MKSQNEENVRRQKRLVYFVLLLPLCFISRLFKLKNIMKPRYNNSRINILHFFLVMRKDRSMYQIKTINVNITRNKSAKPITT